MSAAKRKEALERLADRHGIVVGDDNSSAEDYAAILETPERIGEWCAVTFNSEHGIAYLYPECATVEEAYERAERYLSDSLFSERPEEVVNLDTGERQTPTVGVVAWTKGEA